MEYNIYNRTYGTQNSPNPRCRMQRCVFRAAQISLSATEKMAATQALAAVLLMLLTKAAALVPARWVQIDYRLIRTDFGGAMCQIILIDNRLRDATSEW